MFVLCSAWFAVIVSAAFPPAMLVTVPLAISVTRRFLRRVAEARRAYFEIEAAKARREYLRALQQEASRWN